MTRGTGQCFILGTGARIETTVGRALPTRPEHSLWLTVLPLASTGAGVGCMTSIGRTREAHGVRQLLDGMGDTAMPLLETTGRQGVPGAHHVSLLCSSGAIAPTTRASCCGASRHANGRQIAAPTRTQAIHDSGGAGSACGKYTIHPGLQQLATLANIAAATGTPGWTAHIKARPRTPWTMRACPLASATCGKNFWRRKPTSRHGWHARGLRTRLLPSGPAPISEAYALRLVVLAPPCRSPCNYSCLPPPLGPTRGETKFTNSPTGGRGIRNNALLLACSAPRVLLPPHTQCLGAPPPG